MKKSPGLSPGLVQVYTGGGKGKTTAALGLAWRAVGQGLRVYFLQFLKGQIRTGEALLQPFGDNLSFTQISAEVQGEGRRSTSEQAWWEQPPAAADRAQAQAGLQLARQALISGEYDLVICDEINIACHLELISTEEILSLIQAKPACVELVLTGDKAKVEVIAAADLVTEMRALKHPYQTNTPARRGIEY
jgi:cob(I)alamin adenosyltransferase